MQLSKRQLQNEIDALEAKLAEMRTLLMDYVPRVEELEVGDKLPDGSIVVRSVDGIVVVISQCDWDCPWEDMSNHVLDGGVQWFVPTAQQLKRAWEAAPEQFTSHESYWTSDGRDKECSIAVHFGGKWAISFATDKTRCLRVRPFRCLFI